jgi:alkylation response protein AidB-like acyl-CoA dehydrogenase
VSEARGVAAFGKFSDEQEDLRKAVRLFLDEKSPEPEVRRLMETAEGYDPAVWKQLAGQLGLHGIIVPERFGGSGYTFTELFVVLEEMGRALLCAPFFSSVVLAAGLLLSTDDEAAQQDYLPGIADGSMVATVAVAEASGRWDEAGIGLIAARSGDQWALSGEKHFVTDGQNADVIFVAARAGDGISLFAVDRGAPGLSVTPLTTMDQTRKQARLDLSEVPARLIGAEGQGWAPLARMLELAAVGLAAEQVGGAQRVLDMAVEYARLRVQFGRPIGSFQAIKHKCADMVLRVESAKSAAYYAAWAAATGSDDRSLAASLAKSYCSEAYFYAAAENIQIHGGIGFTWEHPAHLYFKRAKTSQHLFGDPAYHRRLIAGQLGL